MLRSTVFYLELFIIALSVLQVSVAGSTATSLVSTFYSEEAACKVASIRQLPTEYENAAQSRSGLIALTKLDSKGVYQVYTTHKDDDQPKCISCVEVPGSPRVGLNKPMLSWHPSGNWLIVGVEETHHDLEWMPAQYKRGFLQSGIWLNMWITTPTGDRWYQITHFREPGKGPADGFVGTPFSPDGKRAVWAEIVNGNVLANHFGVWKLYIADFVVRENGVPDLVNIRDITPKGARWAEPGNFSPDGRSILISSDIGIPDAQGQDQYVLDTATAQIRNLTNSPGVWDEHGLFSADGSKISFMSSYPYRSEPGSNKLTSLKTEFMVMNADGSHLQQVTHFNQPGYPESQPKRTVAAAAIFGENGSELFGTVMSTNGNFTKTNWVITFEGQCGAR